MLESALLGSLNAVHADPPSSKTMATLLRPTFTNQIEYLSQVKSSHYFNVKTLMILEQFRHALNSNLVEIEL